MVKVWIEVYRKWGNDDDYDPYPRRYYAIIKCYNGRKLMVSKGSHKRRACVILAKKLANYLNIEYRGRVGD